MFEKFMSKNAGDFKQRYRGTYGFYHRGDQKTLVRIENIDLDRRNVIFIDRDENDFTLAMNHDDDIGFSFLAPRAQWYNTSLGACLVARVPQKQYRRGICEGITVITGPNGCKLGVSFNTLHAIFVAPMTLDQAKEQLTSFAIAPQFLLDMAAKRIKCNNFVIGTAGKDSQGVYHIKLDDTDLFRQEVTDAFRRANLEVKFK